MRGLNNWTYKNVTKFLKEHGFALVEQKRGSHENWLSEDKKYIVDVNFRRDEFPIRTLTSMIEDSGIDKKEWRKWAGQ